MTASRTYTAHRAGSFVECREWHADEIRSLRRHWKAGLSIRDIGRKLGRTENSVVGCVHRLKLEPRPSPIIRSAPEQQPRAAAPPSVHTGQIRAGGSGEHVAILETPAPVVPLPGDAASSRPAVFSQCQYPRGERPRWDFCGAPVVGPGEPYCAEHRRLCWATPPRWAA